jgi:hypothetical protein
MAFPYPGISDLSLTGCPCLGNTPFTIPLVNLYVELQHRALVLIAPVTCRSLRIGDEGRFRPMPAPRQLSMNDPVVISGRN